MPCRSCRMHVELSTFEDVLPGTPHLPPTYKYQQFPRPFPLPLSPVSPSLFINVHEQLLSPSVNVGLLWALLFGGPVSLSLSLSLSLCFFTPHVLSRLHFEEGKVYRPSFTHYNFVNHHMSVQCAFILLCSFTARLLS